MAALLSCSPAHAAQLAVYVFMASSPLAGMDVVVDGRRIGRTGAQGEAIGDIEAGGHDLRIVKNAVALAQGEITVGAGENAEVSVQFTDFSQPAAIHVERYPAGQTQGGSPGQLHGFVTDTNGYAVSGATVALNGTQTRTDASGEFHLEAPRGLYTLSVSHPDNQPVTRDNVRMIATIGVAANITMQPTAARQAVLSGVSGDVEEVVVLGTYKPDEQGADLEKFSINITDAISIDDLLRFGDSDVAATLKRLVGVSVTDGKYAVVRGLDGRYIGSTLNGNLMPSTDPFRRDVQLDLFPSEILQGIEIQKSFSADMPGETTGGIIKMTTRGFPEEPEQSFSASLGYVNGTTGEELLAYDGGGSDLLGIDDGTRELPGALNRATNGGRDLSICQFNGQSNCIRQSEAARLAAGLSNNYSPTTETAPPDVSLAYAGGRLMERETGDVGVYGTVSYGRSSSSRQDAFVNEAGPGEWTYGRDATNTTLNAYGVIGWQAVNAWEVVSRTILLRDTEDTTEVASGVNREGRNFDETLLEWVERQFLAQQFSGNVGLFDNSHSLDWRVGLSQTFRYSPDRRSYLYLNDSLAVSTVERSYSELTENGLDLGADYTWPINWTENLFTQLKFGFLANTRTRDVELVRIGVRPGSNQDGSVDYSQDLETLLTAENFVFDVFQLQARSTSTDSYDADQESTALYVSTATDIGPALTVSAGIRQDNFNLSLDFPNASRQSVDLDSNVLLPAMGLSYRLFDDALQLRAGISETVSRPNITELAPSRFYDTNGREFIGCPSCVDSKIMNFDVRAELYYGEADSLTVALFAKDISDPMEVSVADGSGSATSALTFRNNKGATVSGVEIDLNDTVLDTLDHTLKIGANFAVIDSEIELDANSRRLEGRDTRELQGQSPYLANIQLAYDHHPSKQQATLLINWFDDRIDIVTRGQAIGNIYEAGRVTVNLKYKKAFGEQSVSFKLSNLLDAKTEYTQDGNVIESYGTGIAASLGYSVSF